MMFPSGSRKKSVRCQLGRSFGGLSGDFDKNLKLSQDRSEAVVQYLTVKYQIPLGRIMVPVRYGETKLLDTSATATALAKNRRVEVRIMANKGLSPQ
jgi:flagellar motor protein MotB